jgi:hypothetical protein
MKKNITISLDKQVRDNAEYRLDAVNKARAAKLKKELSKSDFYQNLIVIGLIIETNARNDVQKILDAYFEQEA